LLPDSIPMQYLNWFILFLLLIPPVSAYSQITAQWRGPDRSGIYVEKGLAEEWPAEGPTLLWTNTEIGKGYSSAVSAGNRTWVTGMKGQQDYVSALGEKGELLWQVPFGPSWTGSFPETRCTPTLDNGLLYLLSGSGTIACLDAKDGKTVWSFDAYKKFNGACGEWGVCESLLVSGDLVFYTPAGPTTTLVALDKNTGETIWASESLNDTSAYVSPGIISYAGKELLLTMISSYLIGIEAKSGKILWKYNYGKLQPEKGLEIWAGAPKTNTITPVFKDGELYITGGYNHVGAKFRLSEDASAIRLLWTDSTLDCHLGGVVLVDGHIYGSNWLSNSRGNWCCIDWVTGKTLYETNWYCKGAIIADGDRLYCYEEKTGNMGLVKLNPQKFELVSSFKPASGTGPAWAHPSIYNGTLYIRRGSSIMAYDIRKK